MHIHNRVEHHIANLPLRHRLQIVLEVVRVEVEMLLRAVVLRNVVRLLLVALVEDVNHLPLLVQEGLQSDTTSRANGADAKAELVVLFLRFWR